LLRLPQPGDQSATDFSESFGCEIDPERDAVRIRPHGALDMGAAPKLEAQIAELIAAGFRRLIIDLRSLDFMDSAGLHLMLELDAHARSDGITLTLVPGPPAVQRVFEITGTEAALPFADG
jgi:anti-anti-sigma factor